MKELFGIQISDEYFEDCFIKQSKGGKIELIDGQIICTMPTNEELDSFQKLNENANIISQIQALELTQLRPLRELSLDPTNETIKQKIQDIDTQIATLRSNLK